MFVIMLDYIHCRSFLRNDSAENGSIASPQLCSFMHKLSQKFLTNLQLNAYIANDNRLTQTTSTGTRARQTLLKERLRNLYSDLKHFLKYLEEQLMRMNGLSCRKVNMG